MKKLKFRHDDKIVEMEESSHAALFRTFFEWWKSKDLQKTIYGTFQSGLRLSDTELFEGTVIKKRNLPIAPDLYIITHITPKAMDRGILNFLDAVKAEVIEPRNKSAEELDTPDNVRVIDLEAQKNSNEDQAADLNFEGMGDVVQKIAINTAVVDTAEKNLEMKELVRLKMEQRDKEIKEKLARGNRS